MNRIFYILLIIVLIAGCSDTTNSEKSTVEDVEELSNLNNEAEQEYVNSLLEPLLDGIRNETKMIQGSTYQEGMTLENLRTWMLQYYTEELTNETCELIIYKSKQGYGTEYSGMFKYDEITDIFTYIPQEGVSSIISAEEPKPDMKLEIVDILEYSQDRITVTAMLDLDYEKDQTSFMVHLEREGTKWYLSDLVFSRDFINSANRVYKGE